MLRQDDLEVEIIEVGRGEVHVPLNSGSGAIRHLQRLELVETEFSPFLFLADDVAEEESFRRVILTGIPGPSGVGIEELDVQDLLFDRGFFCGIERRKSCMSSLYSGKRVISLPRAETRNEMRANTSLPNDTHQKRTSLESRASILGH